MDDLPLAPAPAVGRAGGCMLLAAGGYVAYCGWWELPVGASGGPVITAAGNVQGWAADGLGPGAVAAA